MYGTLSCNAPVWSFDGLQRAAQSVYHGVSGGQLGIVVQMSVNIGRGRKVTVPQPFLDLLHGYAICQQERGAAMT